MLVGVAFVVMVLRASPTGRPQDALEWTGTALSALLVVFAAALLVLSLRQDEASAETARSGSLVGQPAEDFAFRLLEGDAPAQLSDYEGEVVLLNVWATWCAPCLEEMPALSQLAETYRGEGLRVVTLSDEAPEMLEAFQEERQIQTTMAYLPERDDLPAAFQPALNARPTSYVLDREGRVQQVFLGARTYEVFEEAVTEYL